MEGDLVVVEWVLVHALLLYARRFTGRFEISRDG